MTRGSLRRLRERPELALLLIARGATTAQVGAEFGVSGRTVERVLKALVPDEYAEAIRARPLLRDNHGTVTRYNHQRCRCWPCVEAQNDAMARKRQRRNPPTHGTESAYQNHGCRCAECLQAGRVMNAKTSAAVKAGRLLIRHGSVGRFNQGCRCIKCAFAGTAKHNEVREKNAELIERASRHRQQWTGAELEIALQKNGEGSWFRSAIEVAQMLGRSYYAVVAKRSRETDPRVGVIAGNAVGVDDA